jgi:hypothetical protein
MSGAWQGMGDLEEDQEVAQEPLPALVQSVALGQCAGSMQLSHRNEMPGNAHSMFTSK